MDVNWFKAQQKKAGVTAADIAAIIGRDRSAVSHIYKGERKMSLEWARAFSDALSVPLDEVLQHAGRLDGEQSGEPALAIFEKGDAAPWFGQSGEAEQTRQVVRAFGGDRQGVDVWIVRRPSMILDGYLPGDRLLLDANQSELCRAGDIVIANRYSNRSNSIECLLRRFEPPVLVASSTEPEDRRVVVVDGENVAIRGKIIACWRT
ncbi:helix-turn-helix domain-containing protein [Pseudooceanicola sp.]|uniref:helix-turn-helix domain-containing protein n=1 Tax=Pseudooceanicola sp. TaxID=1914328 RepID=UPI00405A0BC1